MALLVAAGCGGGERKIVPVSGRITVNGKKPPARLHVHFQPVGSKDEEAPGRGSYGATDYDGYFTLKVSGGEDGAVVGKHHVVIGTIIKGEERGENPMPSPDGYAGRPTTEHIPKEYNEQSKLYFDVPAEGTDKANIDLKIPYKP